jgi:hypothetical protein
LELKLLFVAAELDFEVMMVVILVGIVESQYKVRS